MTRKGRDLELLVARIESVFLPSGATVRSPDRLIDRVTGQPREVDVSIRYKLGLIPILITVECRDRQDLQDDTWLEQLITKRQKINAAMTIAVSASGFTAPAIEDARHHGILVRQLDQVTDDEIRRWFAIERVENHIYWADLVAVNTLLYGDVPQTADLFDSDTLELCRQHPLHTPVLLRADDGKQFTASDLIQLGRQKRPRFFRDVPSDGSKIRKTLKLEFPPRLVQFLPLTVPRDVKTIVLTLNLFLERVSVQLDDIIQYSEETVPHAYVAEGDFTIQGQTLICSVIRTPESSDVILRIGKDTP